MDNADDTTKFFVFLCDVDSEEPTFVFMLHNGVWYTYFKDTGACSVCPYQDVMNNRILKGTIVEVKCE